MRAFLGALLEKIMNAKLSIWEPNSEDAHKPGELQDLRDPDTEGAEEEGRIPARPPQVPSPQGRRPVRLPRPSWCAPPPKKNKKNT